MQMTENLRVAHCRYFIGGSDARVIIGDDEAARLRLWREKRGEVEPEDLSTNLIVQLGLATDPGEARRAPDQRALQPLFVVFDFDRLPQAHSRPSPVLIDELDAGSNQRRRILRPALNRQQISRRGCVGCSLLNVRSPTPAIEGYYRIRPAV